MLLMVLNDGETFTSLDGCQIIDAPDDVVDDLNGVPYKTVHVFGNSLLDNLDTSEDNDGQVIIYTGIRA